MAYNLPNWTNETGGLEVILSTGASSETAFMPAILFFLYIAIAGAGYFIQQQRVGRGNLLMWSSISGLIVTTGSFFLLLVGGIVAVETVIIAMLVTIVSVFFFLINGGD